MGLFDFLKKKPDKPEPTKHFGTYCSPIPDSEKQYYQPDSYYTEKSYPGTQFERKVVTFDERKKISYPSRTGLYVAEILLLEYCSYGTYPHPKNGYPGLWWFEYGIRNVGEALSSLESRGYIEYGSAVDQLPKMTVQQLKDLAAKFGVHVSGNKTDIIAQIISDVTHDNIESAVPERKYKLTHKGEIELEENAYIPYMHKRPDKTTEDGTFSPVFNVWEVNRRIANGANWRDIVSEIESEQNAYQEARNRRSTLLNEEFAKKDPEYAELLNRLDGQDKQHSEIQKAEAKYSEDQDIDALIAFWEQIWDNGGLLFNGSKWAFRLPDLYISQKRYREALRILKKIPTSKYPEKKEKYIQRVNQAIEKEKRKKK